MRGFLIAVAVLGVLFRSAPAEACNEWCLSDAGRTLDATGDRAGAAKKWLAAAELGHAPAQKEIARRFHNGDGIGKSTKAAANWYWAAARQGHEDALAMFANIKLAGERPKDISISRDEYHRHAISGWHHYTWYKNYESALRDFREGARKGSGQAMNGLGVAYTKGKGVPRDFRRAIAWFYSGAIRGDDGAMKSLAKFYRWGWELNKNMDRASKWLVKAMALGSEDAKEQLDSYVKAEGDGGSWRDSGHCLKHPTRAANLLKTLAAIAEDEIGEELSLGSPPNTELPDVGYTVKGNGQFAESMHKGATRCSLINQEKNRALNIELALMDYADLNAAVAALKVAIGYVPTEEIFWVDLARVSRWTNARLSADAWNRVWALLGSYPPEKRVRRTRRLADTHRFQITNSVLFEIAESNMRVGDFESAYYYASLIYDGAFSGKRGAEMDWMMAAIGFANGGVLGMNKARGLVETSRRRAGERSAWHARMIEEAPLKKSGPHSGCKTGGHPTVPSVILVEVIDALLNLALGKTRVPGLGRVIETRSRYARYELLQLVRWAYRFRTRDQTYYQTFSCDPERRKRDRKLTWVADTVRKLAAKLPVRKLSRVGELLMARAETYVAKGELNKASNTYYALFGTYEPWYAPAYFNRAAVIVADGGLNGFAIDHLRKYLKLAPNGPRAGKARQLLSKWEPILKDAEQKGRCIRGSICADKKVIEYDHSGDRPSTGAVPLYEAN